MNQKYIPTKQSQSVQKPVGKIKNFGDKCIQNILVRLATQLTHIVFFIYIYMQFFHMEGNSFNEQIAREAVISISS